jgi:hypothetical protein
MGWLVLVSIQRKTASRTAAANDPLGEGRAGWCPRRAAPGGGERTSGFETAMAAVLQLVSVLDEVVMPPLRP